MIYCGKCGAQNPDDARFCAKCGSPIAPSGFSSEEFGQRVSRDAQDFAKKMQEGADRVSREFEYRHGRVPDEVLRNEPVLATLSLGAVLIIVAISFLRYPGSVALLSDYFQGVANAGAWTRPPTDLLRAAAFFFAAVGLWSFVMAVLRLLVQGSARKALNDVIGGLFSLFVAYLLSAYAAFRLGGLGVIAFAVVGIGLAVIARGLVREALPWPKPTA
ncbi:MAG TPA: zinc-ribbon domain-containing protein [Conexivisphaerales archaeon]|nr:zinc-ribbon domain-containing protein [Conexivisphaerales archaeon]